MLQNCVMGRCAICIFMYCYSAPIIDLSERPVESFLHLVQSPFRVFAFGESLPEVILFLLEQLRLAAHSGGTMGEGLDNTKFG